MSDTETSAENNERAVVGRSFAPGVSGNPGGRPPGLARLAREATGDGVDVVGFFTLVSRGKKPAGWPDGEKLTADHMFRANEWLADRGFGKAPLLLDVSGDNGNDDDGLAALTLDELRAGIAFMEMRDGAVAAESGVLPEAKG